MRTSLVKRIMLWTGMVIAALFSGLPILWLVSSSLKANQNIFAVPPKLVDESFSFGAYMAVLMDSEKVRFFINSYGIAAIVVALTLLIALLASYSFSRFSFPGKKILNTIIISVQAVPPITLLIPYLVLVVQLRLYDTYAALVLTYVVFTLPYAILMLTGYLNTLPKELDEAVLIDGGSRFMALWRVLVPSCLPGLVSVGLYTFIQCWNEYLYALTLTKTNATRTVPIGIASLMGQYAFEWNQIMAMSILGSLPVIVIALFFQKYFISGMTAGAVKN
ncbi:multiple sugar transport system permease [Lachnospiraceae bacterium MD308]|nr:multiple sugar transport system permease [Lachnospiraceae bacterium MD308]MCI8504171.1 carbohydrate ABC transporter permease [Dorea sp.]